MLYASKGICQANKSSMSEKENLYLKKIKPNKSVAKGINNGSLILYGQWVKPPYNIEIQGESLLINNVQVMPTIMPPWIEENESVVTNEIQQIADLTDKIQIEYGVLLNDVGEKEAKSKLLQFIGQHNDLILKATWVADDKLHIETTKSIEFSMGFSERAPVSKKRKSDILVADKKMYERQLENGDLLIIGYDATVIIANRKVEMYENDIKAALKSKNFNSLNELVESETLVNELLFISK